MDSVKKHVLLNYTCDDSYNCILKISLNKKYEELEAIAWGLIKEYMPGYLVTDGENYYYVVILIKDTKMILYLYSGEKLLERFEEWEKVDEPLSTIIKKRVLETIKMDILHGIE